MRAAGRGRRCRRCGRRWRPCVLLYKGFRTRSRLDSPHPGRERRAAPQPG